MTLRKRMKTKRREEKLKNLQMMKRTKTKSPKSKNMPKTKAGVIQAAVDMLKKAKKEDAQKIYAKMAKVENPKMMDR